MGGVVSTPRDEAGAEEHGEHLLGVFVGERSQDLSSPFWHKLLSLPLSFHWPEETVKQACEALVQNNRSTAHLAKLLIHLAWSLQEIASASPGTHLTAVKVINATHFSRVFLQHFLRHVRGDGLGEAFILYLNDFDAEFIHLPKGKLSVPSMVLPALLSFIGSSDINPNSYLLQLELVNLLVVMMSSQLYSVPSEGPLDAHPFLDAAMMQESTLVAPFVRKLFLSCIARLPIPSEAAYHANLLKGKQLGVFWKLSSAAATVLMLPYFTYSYLVTSSAEKFSKYPLADNSLLLLLVLTHYGKSRPVDTTLENVAELRDGDATVLDPLSYPSNPFRQALESARDTDFDLVDIVENGQGSSLVKIPFAALYDQIGMCLSDDSWILLLYSLVHGNPAFLEYVLVRTDLDTMLLPVLEMLYNAPRRSANQIYMLLIILLILSQDSSFNASIHKLLLPGVSWYKERLLPQISLGSMVVVILIRTVKYNLSRLRDVFLHTNCLAILANMAPHMHQLNAYASQRLVSLFDMLARKYARLTDVHAITNISALQSGHVEGMDVSDDMPTELHIYTDFLRIVLEIINAILTYALPRNPEVIYALLHRQELFQPFRDHPRFYELLENIYTVLDFFNVRMDDQQHISEEWSVESVLQLIVTTARSWRGDGMKTFTQLRFTYEEELHPEEFFVPYVWQLVVSHSGIQWDTETISLFQARPNIEVADINDKLTILTS